MRKGPIAISCLDLTSGAGEMRKIVELEGLDVSIFCVAKYIYIDDAIKII